MATTLTNQIRNLKVVMLALEGMRRDADDQEIDGIVLLLGKTAESLEGIEQTLCNRCGLSEVKDTARG